jgi:hypothetical protein
LVGVFPESEEVMEGIPGGYRVARESVGFFDASLGGGTLICLASFCTDPGTVCTPAGCVDVGPASPNSLDIFGGVDFSGTF